MTPLNLLMLTQSARHIADCQMKKNRHVQREYYSVTQEGVETGDRRKDRKYALVIRPGQVGH